MSGTVNVSELALQIALAPVDAVVFELDAVVRKALAKRADERFQTAQEFADAIRAAAPAAAVRKPAITVTGSDVGHAGSLSPPAGAAPEAP